MKEKSTDKREYERKSAQKNQDILSRKELL